MSGSKTSAWRRSRPAVDAVGGDDEIRIGVGRVIRDLVLETLVDAELRRPLLQDVQQALAADAAEAVPAGPDGRAAVMDVDVVPMVEAGRDRLVRRRVGRAKAFHGPV